MLEVGQFFMDVSVFRPSRSVVVVALDGLPNKDRVILGLLDGMLSDWLLLADVSSHDLIS